MARRIIREGDGESKSSDRAIASIRSSISLGKRTDLTTIWDIACSALRTMYTVVRKTVRKWDITNRSGLVERLVKRLAK
jgi:hypothetical protein